MDVGIYVHGSATETCLGGVRPCRGMVRLFRHLAELTLTLAGRGLGQPHRRKGCTRRFDRFHVCLCAWRTSRVMKSRGGKETIRNDRAAKAGPDFTFFGRSSAGPDF